VTALRATRAGGPMRNRNGHTADRLTEWLFALMMITWGCWLLNPAWETFRAPQYAALREIAGEAVWGAWSISIGAIRCAALYVNGAHRRTPAVRAICAGLGAIWWLVLSFLFLSAPVANPAAGFSWYPVFIVFEFACVWRSARDGWQTKAFSWRRHGTA
jgi:hypothetical protein